MKLSENPDETDLLYMSQAAVSSARGSRTGKLHTALMKLGVKRVVLGNFDGDTLAVSVILFRKELPVVRATRDR